MELTKVCQKPCWLFKSPSPIALGQSTSDPFLVLSNLAKFRPSPHRARISCSTDPQVLGVFDQDEAAQLGFKLAQLQDELDEDICFDNLFPVLAKEVRKSMKPPARAKSRGPRRPEYLAREKVEHGGEATTTSYWCSLTLAVRFSRTFFLPKSRCLPFNTSTSRTSTGLWPLSLVSQSARSPGLLLPEKRYRMRSGLPSARD